MEFKTMNAGSNNPGGEGSPIVESPNEMNSRPAADFPNEPFACPNCGQMLAPSVRTCPSCRQAIDPNEIARPQVVIPIAEQVIPLSPVATKQHAQFSWGIFFATLGIWFVAAFAAEALLGYEKSQFVLFGLVVLTSAWVLQDARKKNIPKPFRWSIGSLLLWILIFPWYLARRRTPKAACPMIEGEGRHVRTLLIVLLVFFLLMSLLLLLKGPSHSSGGRKPATQGVDAPAGKIASLTGLNVSSRPIVAPPERS